MAQNFRDFLLAISIVIIFAVSGINFIFTFSISHSIDDYIKEIDNKLRRNLVSKINEISYNLFSKQDTIISKMPYRKNLRNIQVDEIEMLFLKDEESIIDKTNKFVKIALFIIIVHLASKLIWFIIICIYKKIDKISTMLYSLTAIIDVCGMVFYILSNDKYKKIKKDYEEYSSINEVDKLNSFIKNNSKWSFVCMILSIISSSLEILPCFCLIYKTIKKEGIDNNSNKNKEEQGSINVSKLGGNLEIEEEKGITNSNAQLGIEEKPKENDNKKENN